MGVVTDLRVIDKEDIKKWKKLIGKKLKKIEIGYGDLILHFEGMSVTVSMQYSEAYGTNVFWNFEKEG